MMRQRKRNSKQPLTGGQGLKLPHNVNMPPRAGNSSSWSSHRTLEGARLTRLQNMASHLGISRSPFFPKNIGQYATHLQEIHADRISIEHERIRLRTLQLNTVDEFGKPPKYGKFLNGKTLEFKRMDAKGMKQEMVWSFGTNKPDDEPVRKTNWPNTIEAKLDGEYRVKKGLQRQLPLPRKVGETAVAQLMSLGIEAEMATKLLRVPENEFYTLLNDALDHCEIDELAWMLNQADRFKTEEEEHGKWLGTQQDVVYGPNGIWEVDEVVPMGGHCFDEEDLKQYGEWVELLNELDLN